LRQPAILASVAGSATDKGPQCVVHYECPRTMARALACSTVITSIART
jgi:hypothetical protein